MARLLNEREKVVEQTFNSKYDTFNKIFPKLTLTVAHHIISYLLVDTLHFSKLTCTPQSNGHV